MKLEDYVKKYDVQNQFDVLAHSFKQVEFIQALPDVKIDYPSETLNSIVVCGLGGSAIGADLFYNMFGTELKQTYFVNRNYSLPTFVNQNTLVVLSSYSGNTEETLSAAEKAKEIGAKIVCIASGGKLKEIAEENGYPVVLLQQGFQPRYALYLNLFALIKIFQSVGIIEPQEEFFTHAVALLKERGKEFQQENSSPFKFAESLVGYIPVIYSVDNVTSAVGLRLKGQFNENSKSHAFHNVLPEFNHNEIVGWETYNENNFRAKAIFIYDDVYHPQIKKRIQISSELIEKAGAEVLKIKSSAPSFKLRVIENVYFGDWVSYYLAILRDKDPSEIDNILYLKGKLAED